MTTDPQPVDTLKNAIRAIITPFAEAVAKSFKAAFMHHVRKRMRRASDIHRRRFHRNPKRRALRK